MDWSRLIKEIMAHPLEADSSQRWRCEDIGEIVGLSSSTIGRMHKYPGTNEPKYRKGVALIKLNAQVKNGRYFSEIKRLQEASHAGADA